MDKKALIIKTPEQLKCLLKTSAEEASIILQIEGLDNSKDWEERINKDYSDCGCKIGAISVITSLIAYVMYMVLVGKTSYADINQADITMGIAIFVLSIILGKLAGLLNARIKLKRSIRTLIKQKSENQGVMIPIY